MGGAVTVQTCPGRDFFLPLLLKAYKEREIVVGGLWA